MRWRPHRVDFELTLDDGTVAEACLTPAAAEWLELREGQIIWVDVRPAVPRLAAPEREAACVSA